MNENQYKLIKQVRNYIENVNPVLKNFSSFYSYCNHYAFNTYDLWHDIPNDIDFSDKVTLNNTYFKSSKSSSCHRICFGKFLNKLSRSSRAQFIWMPYITTPNSQGCANFTWLTKEELEKHVLYPKTHYGLDYNVRVYSPEEFVYTDDSEDLPFGTYFTVIFDFKKLTYINIKFVLFWARYATEFPSNLVLLDAKLLKQLYPEEELLNLLIMSSMFFRYHNTDNYSVSYDQCISLYGKFATKEYLIKRMYQNPEGSLISIFDRFHVNYSNDMGFQQIINCIERSKQCHFRDNPKDRFIQLTRFLEDKEVERRLSYYVNQLYDYYKKEELTL